MRQGVRREKGGRARQGRQAIKRGEEQQGAELNAAAGREEKGVGGAAAADPGGRGHSLGLQNQQGGTRRTGAPRSGQPNQYCKSIA